MQQKLLFGELLRKERKKRGLTQEELAGLAGNICTGSYVSYLERAFVSGTGKRLPKPDVLVIDKLADVLKIPPKAARDAANLALPESEPGRAMEGIFSMLFVGYERLSPLYREMAITLCGGILNNLYEIQLGNAESQSALSEASSRRAGLTAVPVIYAMTEAESAAAAVGEGLERR